MTVDFLLQPQRFAKVKPPLQNILQRVVLSQSDGSLSAFNSSPWTRLTPAMNYSKLTWLTLANFPRFREKSPEFSMNLHLGDRFVESMILRSPEMEILYNFRPSLTSYFHRMFPRNASWHQREARARSSFVEPHFFELFVPHPRARRQQTTRGVAYTMLLYDVNGLPGGHDMGGVGG